ncbi:uncharacterized protein J3R85_016289 [Psidium guajava]|nr:uncharacterized protein J3R85_016289 [Psidium guajava]
MGIVLALRRGSALGKQIRRIMVQSIRFQTQRRQLVLDRLTTALLCHSYQSLCLLVPARMVGESYQPKKEL